MNIMRFDFTSRLLHWSHTVVFIWLLVTGAQLFLTRESLLGDPLIKMVHLYASPLFIILPLVLYHIGSPATRRDVTELMTWTDYDVRWIADYLTRKKTIVIGKFDAGQKVDFMGTVFLLMGLTFTGSVVWMKAYFSVGFVELNFLAHDILAVLAVLLFGMHLVFAIYYRALHGIIYGDVHETWAQEHFPGWYDRSKFIIPGNKLHIWYENLHYEYGRRGNGPV